MRKSFKCMVALALSVAMHNSISAQEYYDITDNYLENASFDNRFDYGLTATGNVDKEILEVDGWTKNFTHDYTISGVYRLGTKATFCGLSVPKTDANGKSSGGVLVLVTKSNMSMRFYQTVELPAGKYRIVSSYYNADATVKTGKSQVGWVPKGKVGTISKMKTFECGEWTPDTIDFELTEATVGNIQVGTLANSGDLVKQPKLCFDYVRLLRDTPYSAADVAIYAKKLTAAIEEAEKTYGDGTGNEADKLKAAIDKAKQAIATATSKTEIDAAVDELNAAVEAYIWANPTGAIPTVTTNKRFARGATMAFGRMSLTANGANVIEQGFCYGNSPEPTIFDNRTTATLNNKGTIYWLQDLKPSTKYYMRAYAITNGRQVAYGDVIKFYTIPKGNITCGYNNGGDAAANTRINNAIKEACEIFNALTAIKKGFNMGYSAGTPTADCAYVESPWINMGANASYQRTGTIMHEMQHGLGVIPYSTQWNKNILRERLDGDGRGTGRWLGDRVSEFLNFWDNTSASYLNGDYQHMWPYGINGANEDNGSKELYFANALIGQALGEDGLEHRNGTFADPYYALDQEDDTKFYIKNESENRGLNTSYLMPTADGTLRWVTMSSEKAAANDSVAWYFTFTPSNQYYQIRNAATGQYITYSNGIRTLARTAPGVADNWHLMKGRVDVKGHRGYWIIRPESNWEPKCLQAEMGGATSAVKLDKSNDANAQRWLILTTEEMMAYEKQAISAEKNQVFALLAEAKKLAATPHSEDAEGTDLTFDNAIGTVESGLSAASTLEEVAALYAATKDAIFNFLKNASAIDANVPFNITFMLTNPTINSNTEGWSQEASVNYGCAEYYQKTFDFYQTVKNLPAGNFLFALQGFERPGTSADSYNAYANGTNKVSALVYAGTASQKMAHIASDAQSTSLSSGESNVGNGMHMPNNMESASKYFAKGLYFNTLPFTVDTDGTDVTMGIKAESMPTSYWVIFDNFGLFFYGDTVVPTEVDAKTGIDMVNGEERIANYKTIFNLQGQRVKANGNLKSGLYIIGGKKIMVK